MPTVHLRIKGKVQGVFYRASAKKTAEAMHITGWVKNTGEGHVEITAAAAKDDLEQFIGWCRQGPPRAVVTEVIVTTIENKNFDGFEIR